MACTNNTFILIFEYSEEDEAEWPALPCVLGELQEKSSE